MVGTDRQSGGVSAEKGEKRVILSFTCNGLTRRIQRVENAVVAVRQDSNVDTVRMIFRPEEFNNIPLSTVSVKFLYVDTDGEIKAYQTGTTPDGGVYVADWELTDDVVDDAGYINFAVKLAVVNGDIVEKQWFSIPDTFRVYDSVDDTNNPPGEAAAEQATNAEKIAQLQSQLGTVTSDLSSLTSTVALHGAALDTLNSNTYSLGVGTAISSGTDMDTITTVGNYISASGTITNSLSNCPVSGYGFRLTVEAVNTTGVILQKIASGHKPSQHYERRGQVASNVWSFSTWEQKPTRAEVDTITDALGLLSNEHYNYDTGAAGTYEYTLEHSSAYLICIVRVNASVKSIGLYLANPYPTGNGFLLVPIVEINPSFASVSLTNATLTITVSSNYMRVGITKIA